MNEPKKRPVRRLQLSRTPISKEALIDLLALLPDEALIEPWGVDFASLSYTVGVYHPSFSEIPEFQPVPQLQVVEETRRTFFGSYFVHPVKLIDETTGKEVRKEQ